MFIYKCICMVEESALANISYPIYGYDVNTIASSSHLNVATERIEFYFGADQKKFVASYM